MTLVSWLAALCMCRAAATVPRVSLTRAALAAELTDQIHAFAEQANQSLSLGVAYTNRTTGQTESISIAAGADDRATPGSTVDTDSLFPAGSAAKPWAAVAAFRLADASLPVRPGGFLLDLDAPAIPIADAWLQKQGLAGVSDMFRDDHASASNMSALLHNVTVRDLLSMQAGLSDYDDGAMQSWTVSHPCSGADADNCDISPWTYIKNSSHILNDCTVGVGCVDYSGNSFIVAGFAMAAAAGAKTYADLDTRRLVNDLLAARGGKGGNGDGKNAAETAFDKTLFMGPGPCSKDAHVVHQYGIKREHKMTAARAGAGAGAGTKKDQWKCQNQPVADGAKWLGGSIVSKTLVPAYLGWGTCCARAAQESYKYQGRSVIWSLMTHHPTNSSSPRSDQGQGQGLENNTCVVSVVWGPGKASQVSDKAAVASGHGSPPKLGPGDFFDLYDDSCLNGWVMGNIALHPEEQALFWHRLLNGRLVSTDDLASMQEWKEMQQGWMAHTTGFKYGTGLMLFPGYERGVDGHQQNWTTRIGHGGVDWGSQTWVDGYIPALDAALVVASNTELTPMNFSAASLASAPQRRMGGDPEVQCVLLDTVARYLRPELERLKCFY